MNISIQSRTASRLLAPLALAASVSVASAQTIYLEYQSILPTTPNNQMRVTNTSGTDTNVGNVRVGMQNFQVSLNASGNPFDDIDLFCVELGQFAPENGDGFVEYQVLSGSQANSLGTISNKDIIPDVNTGSGIGAAAIGRAGDLYGAVFGTSYDVTVLDTNGKRAAFQYAVWEVTHDDDFLIATKPGGTAPSPSDNGFYVSGLDQSNLSGIFKQAQDYLDLISGSYTGPSFNMFVLASAEYQDYLIPDTVPVPEPSTYAIFLGGLAGAFALLRRRMKRAA